MGLREPDDAAVWRLDDERAIVVTTGNAGATWVVVNGVPAGSMGRIGEIATLEYVKGKDPRPLG